jgi:hypothetical protein
MAKALQVAACRAFCVLGLRSEAGACRAHARFEKHCFFRQSLHSLSVAQTAVKTNAARLK